MSGVSLLECAQRRRWPDWEDRQYNALTGGALILFGVPVVVGLGSLFVTGWMYVLGMHGIHGEIWGWLSDRKLTPKSHQVYYEPNTLPLTFILSVLLGYATYQVAELFAWAFRIFSETLS